jgi:nucleoside 2-deoxyribosyltransferase
MGKCILTKDEIRSVALRKYDGWSFKAPDFYEYWIDGFTYSNYNESLKDQERFNLLHETVKLNNEGLLPFWVCSEKDALRFSEPNIVVRVVSQHINKKIEHSEKEFNLLKLIASKSSKTINPFEGSIVSLKDRVLLNIPTQYEYFEWLNSLVHKGLVYLDRESELFRVDYEKYGNNEKEFLAHLDVAARISLTVNGWGIVDDLSNHEKSRDVFVAMAFTDEKKKKLPTEPRDSIKSTISSIGWNPVIVDEVEHNDGIMDKVLASINSSAFVVAELTYQKTGVYYEAGFAKGKGLPVIHIVNREDFDNCHFDVRHLNSNPPRGTNLKKRLKKPSFYS